MIWKKKVLVTVILFVFFWIDLGFTTHQDYFICFESVYGGAKTGDPWEKTPDHPQAELDLCHMWPELGSNPQWWDDRRFRVLKISDLNHSAAGAARKDLVGLIVWFIQSKCV